MEQAINNSSVKLYPLDKILQATILKIIPNFLTPNHFTVLRLLLTPIVILFILKEKIILGLILFLFAALTDAIDGAMARTRNQITEWGKVYDPIADKLLIGATACLLISKYLNLYFALFIILIEILLVANGTWRKSNGNIIEANVWGKIKMILQTFGIALIFIFMIFNIHFLIIASWAILIIACFFAMISLFTYSI